MVLFIFDWKFGFVCTFIRLKSLSPLFQTLWLFTLDWPLLIDIKDKGPLYSILKFMGLKDNVKAPAGQKCNSRILWYISRCLLTYIEVSFSPKKASRISLISCLIIFGYVFYTWNDIRSRIPRCTGSFTA